VRHFAKLRLPQTALMRTWIF